MTYWLKMTNFCKLYPTGNAPSSHWRGAVEILESNVVVRKLDDGATRQGLN